MLVSHNESPVYEAKHSVVRRFPTTGDGYDNSETFFLPPLDVLMVWHAYMLNPRIYLEDSVRYTKQTLWRTSFPWERIFKIIDKETFDYSPGSKSVFEQATRLSWDSLQDERLATVKCPKCRAARTVLWTRPPTEPVPEALEIYLANDTGFAGSGFEHRCSSCGLIITHEKLRVGKFCDDTDSLIHNKKPLSGTILNAWGEPLGKSPFLVLHEACTNEYRNYDRQETRHPRSLLPQSHHRDEDRLQRTMDSHANVHNDHGNSQTRFPESRANVI